MNFKTILRVRIKKNFTEPVLLIFILATIIISLVAGILAERDYLGGAKTALVDLDQGPLSKKLIGLLDANRDFDFRLMDEGEALRLIKLDKIEALFIIKEGFSENLYRGDFEGMLEFISSPSSKASSSLSEAVVNAATMIWIEELSILKARDFIVDSGRDYGVEDEEGHRKSIKALWESGPAVIIKKEMLDSQDVLVTEKSASKEYSYFYALISLFYLLADTSWLSNLKHRGTNLRLKHKAIAKWKLILFSSIPSLIISFAGFIVGLLGLLLLGKIGLFDVLFSILPMLLYLIASLGITLFVVSLTGDTLSLIFLSPLIAFFNGALSGLIVDLPSWAWVLDFLARGLPGRWLKLAHENMELFSLGAILTSLLWLGLGFGASVLKREKV